MQEESDRQIGTLAAEHRRHQLELVVLHPDRRAVGCHLGQLGGKSLVDHHVGVPLVAVERRLTKGVVVQRPQTVVGEALVVPLDLVAADAHGVQIDPLDLERLGSVVGVARPAEPEPTRFAQHGQQRTHQAAGARCPPVVSAHHREPVGGDDDGGFVGSVRLFGWSVRWFSGVRMVGVVHRWSVAGAVVVGRNTVRRSFRFGRVPVAGRRPGRRHPRCRPRGGSGCRAPRAANRLPTRASSLPGVRSGSRPLPATPPA